VTYRGTVRRRRAAGGSATAGQVGSAGRAGRQGQHVYQITAARLAVPDDVAARQRRYLVSMTIRTVCFVAAIIVSGWLRWVLLVGALALPYISVVFANGGREQVGDFPAEQPTPTALPAGDPPPRVAPPAPPGPEGSSAGAPPAGAEGAPPAGAGGGQ